MGRSFAAPRPEILIEDFEKNNSYFHPASATYYQMLKRGGVLIQRRYQLGFEGKETNVDEKQVDYIVGSGNHMRTYVHRERDGTLLELPLAWYAEKGGYWAMNPGYDRAGLSIRAARDRLRLYVLPQRISRRPGGSRPAGGSSGVFGRDAGGNRLPAVPWAGAEAC